MTWLPVTDYEYDLPDPGAIVLIWAADRVWIASRNELGLWDERGYHGMQFKADEPTHWMPLPAEPR